MLLMYQILIAAVILGLLILLSPAGRRPKAYPPGPPTLPILGNFHQIPKRDVYLQFEKWARQYGPVYSLILGSKTMIVLSQDKAVKDLLDKKSAIYSDREENYVAQTLCSGDLRVAFLRYGPRWRSARKLVHNLLSISLSRSYVPYQDLENKQMLYEMITQPDAFLSHIRRSMNAQTTSMVFGWRTSTCEDEKMKQLFDGFTEAIELSSLGSAAIMEYFPWVRKFPDLMFPTKTKAKKLHRREKALYLGHWLKAKEDAQNGTLKKCFCLDMAAAQAAEGFSDDQAAYISGTLLEAGSDTISNTLYGFVQAMLLFPEAQKKAQEELDHVVGPDRLPTMDDFKQLPYIRACMKETARWMPTSILGAISHSVIQDDYYEGYLIPKNATVLINTWAIHMDPQRHPNPRTFDPSRYIGDDLGFADSANNTDYNKRDHFIFGAGRRLCPGIHVAENSLFLAISRLAWGFNIEPALDPRGQPIIPDPERLTQGLVCMPEEFPAKIIPRSLAHEDLMIQEWKRAEQDCLDPETKQWRHTPV